MKNRQKKINYSFTIDPERLLEFSKMPVKARLEWLEEANKFVRSISGGKVFRRWQKLRAEKI
jgi:hypothetical protein